jgi:hypothetical protein
MGKLANIAKAALAATLGLVFAIAMVEILPRVLPGVMPRKLQAVQRIYEARNSWESMMRGDKDLGFVLQPDLNLEFPSEGRSIPIHTTGIPVAGAENIGFRDIGTKTPFDAVAVGDSFTFCDDAPPESCWVRKLSEKTGLSVATFGVNGYSNLAEARLLDKVSGMQSLRVVFVGFFPNDFKDNLHFSNWSRSETDDYWTWMRRKRRSDLSDTLARDSVLYRLIDAARRYGNRDTFEHKADGVDFVFRADAWWSEVLDKPGQTPGFRLAEDAFDQMAATAKRMNARLVVLLFPFKEQVYWDIARKYYADVRDLTEADIDAPFTALKDSLAKRGIETCDLTAPLRARAKQGPQLYLRVGAHWTDAGNQAAADAIAACMSASVPPRASTHDNSKPPA